MEMGGYTNQFPAWCTCAGTGHTPSLLHAHLGRGTVSPLDPFLTHGTAITGTGTQSGPPAPSSTLFSVPRPTLPRCLAELAPDLYVCGVLVNASLLSNTDSFGFHQILSI